MQRWSVFDARVSREERCAERHFRHASIKTCRKQLSAQRDKSIEREIGASSNALGVARIDASMTQG